MFLDIFGVISNMLISTLQTEQTFMILEVSENIHFNQCQQKLISHGLIAAKHLFLSVETSWGAYSEAVAT